MCEVLLPQAYIVGEGRAGERGEGLESDVLDWRKEGRGSAAV